ncbi:flagellar protein FliT [Allochromatium vinosum]|uniref:Flagellar protein FliT n=1 Tax=Allochromatium vinosum (strain ATCC 17899 / DSM 180 / NBRC 103801 / NCIMB 10441 / D) TaxID=572477 RepID=D3RMG2_ALLVD|nr:flagellar protein FliT [Allochromatium vinosum]ADC61220.1 hypothetical protein Alvin_0255 [Allochromatium vinosum DSM 180]MBK1655929.1 flagellar protein FliT [Allochromatium vinosum]
MANLTDLISDLVAATDQMKPAAQGDDWDMVERLQKRRRVLIESIVERAAHEPITEEDAERLRAVRRHEATVAALAGTQRQALREAIAELQGEGRIDKLSRMQRAYRDSGYS